MEWIKIGCKIVIILVSYLLGYLSGVYITKNYFIKTLLKNNKDKPKNLEYGIK